MICIYREVVIEFAYKFWKVVDQRPQVLEGLLRVSSLGQCIFLMLQFVNVHFHTGKVAYAHLHPVLNVCMYLNISVFL